MIFGTLALLMSAAAGSAALWQSRIADLRPRWAAWLVAAGGGFALGLGASAILYLLAAPFRLTLVCPALVWLLVPLARRKAVTAPQEPRSFKETYYLMGACAIALAIIAGAMAVQFTAQPHGNWDAWSIWNVRAKFLASPEYQRAWSPQLATAHPEYPLLLPAAVAYCWSGGSSSPEIPAAVSILFYLALIAVCTGTVAVLRGPVSGLIAALVLIATPGLAAEVPAQYADVPMTCYYVCALCFLLLNRPGFAGVFAGMAALTKDEGILFCVALLAVAALFRRTSVPWLAAAIVPTLAVIVALKMAVFPHVMAQLGPGAFSRMFDLSRYWPLLGGLLSSLTNLGTGVYHPVIPLAICAVAIGLRDDGDNDRRLSATLTMTMLVGYCAVLLATPNNYQWQLDTAFSRLIVQVWPLAVTSVLIWMRSAEDRAPQPIAAKSKRHAA